MQLISNNVHRHVGLSPHYDAIHVNPTNFNFTSPQAYQSGHPWDVYRTLREQAPITWHQVEPLNTGFWLVANYAGIQHISRNPELFSSQQAGILMSVPDEKSMDMPLQKASFNTMICMDGDNHAKLRGVHQPFFSPDKVGELKRKVSAKIDNLLDDIAPLDEFNFVDHFSSQLPLYTLSVILGIDNEDLPKLIKWVHYLELAALIVRGGTVEEMSDPKEFEKLFVEFQNAFDEMFDYGKFAMQERRSKPQPDLMNAIAWAELENSQLNQEYLDGSWLLILFAGNDTTRNSLSGSMKLFTENPEQKNMLLSNPSLMPNAVEEMIRSVTPVIYMSRTATQNTEVLGQMIAKGEKLIMYYGSANRDDKIFEQPEVFDIQRKNANRHLSFGFGKHVCIGNRVARMQLQMAYEKIFERYPTMHYTGEMEIAPNNFVHAISKLMVRK